MSRRKGKKPNFVPLKDALIEVECAADLFLYEHRTVAEQFVPKAVPFPIRLPIDEVHKDCRWAQMVQDFCAAFMAVHVAVERAIELVPTAEPLDGDARSPADRWTVKTRIALRDLAGMIHWTSFGKDGIGFLRGSEVPTIPAAFADRLRDIAERRLLLLDLVAQGLPTASGVARPPAKHPSKVTEADKLSIEMEVGLHLRDNPEATRDGTAAELGISGGRVSATKAWKAFAKQKREARAASKAIGRGGDTDLDSIAAED